MAENKSTIGLSWGPKVPPLTCVRRITSEMAENLPQVSAWNNEGELVDGLFVPPREPRKLNKLFKKNMKDTTGKSWFDMPAPTITPENARSQIRTFKMIIIPFFADLATASTWIVSVLHSDLLVLVEFWASWCGPCRMVDRVIDEIALEYVGRIKCFKLDTDKYPLLASDHGVERIPTVLLFKNGEKLKSITGTMPKSVYVTAIESFLAS